MTAFTPEMRIEEKKGDFWTREKSKNWTSIPSHQPIPKSSKSFASRLLAENAERMRYPKFGRQHLFVGSGVIEAGCKCKTVIGSRLKQSGIFWTVRGANAIIALRWACRSSQ